MQLKHQPAPAMEAAPAKMFDGRFFLTNPFSKDYTCKWNGVEYTFQAMTTAPLIIEDATPLQTQSIRRKFAADIGTAEFMRSAEYARVSGMEKKSEGHMPGNYIPLVKNLQTGEWDEASPIAKYALKCLEPLPIKEVKVGRPRKKEVEQKIDPKTGRPIITVMNHEDQGARSLTEEAKAL